MLMPEEVVLLLEKGMFATKQLLLATYASIAHQNSPYSLTTQEHIANQAPWNYAAGMRKGRRPFNYRQGRRQQQKL
jgi:hypothetical protein